MTREEALRIAHEKWARPKIKCSESIVDTLTALGILKLDEPKTARDRYFRMANREVGPVIASVIFDRLEGIGLRIVEK